MNTPANKKSNAERSGEYKLKKHLKDTNFKEKERIRIKEYREKKKKYQSEAEKLSQCEREKSRKQKYRLAKKLEKNNLTTLDTHLSYKTPQALGKAISRVSQKLPNSPRKKTAVIKVLAKRAGVFPAEKSKKKSASCISEETIKFVKHFYTRSDIVYTMPGMKDELTAWEKGAKRCEQKYYLAMFLREAYSIYINLPVTEKVKFSKFCELRPKNVLLLNQSPADQCKCMIHENFINKLKGAAITYDSSTFWNFVLCDDSLNSVCWQRNCEDCIDGKKLNLNIDPATNVSWNQWCYVESNENHQKKIQSIT